MKGQWFLLTTDSLLEDISLASGCFAHIIYAYITQCKWVTPFLPHETPNYAADQRSAAWMDSERDAHLADLNSKENTFWSEFMVVRNCCFHKIQSK